jgi:hypothetical protein
VGLKAWHIYGLILIPVLLLFIGVTYGANERDGTVRTVEQGNAAEEDEPGGPEQPPGPGGPEEPGGGGPPPGGLRIVATDNEFDTSELTAPAGQEATIELVNEGSSLHNWAIPGEDVATELIPGGEATTATFNLPAGEYDYLCEVHPDDMTGTLIVQ